MDMGLGATGCSCGYIRASNSTATNPRTCATTPLIFVGVFWHLFHRESRRLRSAGNTRRRKLTHYDTLMIKLSE